MEQPDQEIQNFIYGIFKSFGFDSVLSKIVSILFIEPEEVSLEELSRQTGYSLSSISTKMKLLTSVGSVERIKKPGSKKVYFYMDNDMKKIMTKKIDVTFDLYLNPVRDKLPALIKEYKENTKGSRDEKDKKKIKILEDYHKDMMGIRLLLEKFKQDMQKL